MPTKDKYTRTLTAKYMCTLDAHNSRYTCPLDATRDMQLPAIQTHQGTADDKAGAKNKGDDTARGLHSQPEGENLADSTTRLKLPNLIQSPSFRCANQAQLPGCSDVNGATTAAAAAADAGGGGGAVVCSPTSPTAATLCHKSSSGSKDMTSLFSSSCVCLPPILQGRDRDAVSCIPAHGSSRRTSRKDSKLPNISTVQQVAVATNKNTRGTHPTVNTTRTRRRPTSSQNARPTRFMDRTSKQPVPAACSPSAHALLLPLRGCKAHVHELARKQKQQGDNCNKQNLIEPTKLPSAL